MSLTIFPDIVFRHSVISGALRGRQIRKNQRVSTANGIETVNIVWDRTKREWDIATIPLLRSEWQYIESLHEITEGGAYGFLLEDPKDFHSTDTTPYTETIGKVAALGSGQYQAFKRYKNVASGRYKDRKITRLNPTGFQVYNGVVLMDPSSYTLDVTTGILSISGNPSEASVTWRGRFYVPVHFQNDIIDWTLEAPGPEEVRYFSGPSVVLEEVWE